MNGRTDERTKGQRDKRELYELILVSYWMVCIGWVSLGRLTLLLLLVWPTGLGLRWFLLGGAFPNIQPVSRWPTLVLRPRTPPYFGLFALQTFLLGKDGSAWYWLNGWQKIPFIIKFWLFWSLFNDLGFKRCSYLPKSILGCGGQLILCLIW